MRYQYFKSSEETGMPMYGVGYINAIWELSDEENLKRATHELVDIAGTFEISSSDEDTRFYILDNERHTMHGPYKLNWGLVEDF